MEHVYGPFANQIYELGNAAINIEMTGIHARWSAQHCEKALSIAEKMEGVLGSLQGTAAGVDLDSMNSAAGLASDAAENGMSMIAAASAETSLLPQAQALHESIGRLAADNAIADDKKRLIELLGQLQARSDEFKQRYGGFYDDMMSIEPMCEPIVISIKSAVDRLTVESEQIWDDERTMRENKWRRG